MEGVDVDEKERSIGVTATCDIQEEDVVCRPESSLLSLQQVRETLLVTHIDPLGHLEKGRPGDSARITVQHKKGD